MAVSLAIFTILAAFHSWFQKSQTPQWQRLREFLTRWCVKWFSFACDLHLTTTNVQVACPIVYGSIAFWQGRKADEYHTHKWTCTYLVFQMQHPINCCAVFVRGPNHEDLSIVIEKVVFTLHPSFAQPVRGVSLGHFGFEVSHHPIAMSRNQRTTILRQ